MYTLNFQTKNCTLHGQQEESGSPTARKIYFQGHGLRNRIQRNTTKTYQRAKFINRNDAIIS